MKLFLGYSGKTIYKSGLFWGISFLKLFLGYSGKIIYESRLIWGYLGNIVYEVVSGVFWENHL